MEEKRRGLEDDLEYWRAKEDPIGVGQTLANLAYLDLMSGDIELARKRYEESIGVLRGTGDDTSLAAALHEMANLEWKLGHLEAARAYYEQSRNKARLAGDSKMLAFVAHGLAMLEWQQGNVEAARKGFEESLGVKRTLNDPANTAATEIMLGQALFKEGERSRGLDLMRAAVGRYQSLSMVVERDRARDILLQYEQMGKIIGASDAAEGGSQIRGPESSGDTEV